MFSNSTILREVKENKEIKPIANFLFLPKKFWIDAFYDGDIASLNKLCHGDYAAYFNKISNLMKDGLIEIEYSDKKEEVTGVISFKSPNSNKVAVICPGGGYDTVCSYQEGFPYAMKLLDHGFNVFILHYHIKSRMPIPLDDLANLYRHIQRKYPSFDIENSLLIGSSAGGHLAGIYCTKKVGYQKYNLPCPKMLCLAYPVVTMKELTHGGSRNNILGIDPNEELKELYSIESNIDKDFPKTFLWQGEKDDIVPFKNSIILDGALSSNNVEHRYIHFPDTCHGWGIGIGTIAEGWFEQMLNYFNII